MGKPLPSTGDTQAVCIIKPDSFVEWCVQVTEQAMEQQPQEKSPSTAAVEKQDPDPGRDPLQSGSKTPA